MSIYSLSYNILTERLSPPSKRMPLFLAWLRALAYPLQWLRDNIFDSYANGDLSSDWSNVTQYYVYDRVRYEDGSIYEAIASPTIGEKPTNTEFWYKVCESWIGTNERIMYNSQSLMFEYVINKQFNTVFRQPNSETSPTRSDIYTDNKSENKAFNIAIDSTLSDAAFVTESLSNNAIYETYVINIVNFTLYVPLATFNTFGATDTIRESKVRNFTNKYIISGITYAVTPY